MGLLATTGTVASRSYIIETEKFFPDIEVVQEACPMWVPLVENNEHLSEGADYFVRQPLHRLLERAPQIDAVVLGCTHYPLLRPTLQKVANDLWGHPVSLVDSAEAMAASTEKLLAMQDLLARGDDSVELHPTDRLRCFVTDEARVADVAARFLGRPLPQVDLVDL